MFSISKLILSDGCLDITINISGSFLDTSEASFAYQHNHADYEVQLFGGSGCRYKIGRESGVVGPGSIIVIPPQLRHSMLPPEDGTFDRYSFTVGFAGDDRGELGYLSRSFSTLNSYKIIEGEPTAFRLLDETAAELRNPRPGRIIMIKANLLAALCTISRRISALPGKESEPVICGKDRSHIIEGFFSQCYGEDCTCENLANQLYVSQRQVGRILRRLYGRSFREMQLQTRMEIANYFLEETSLSISDIAAKLGYNSINAFYLAYRKYYGHPPGRKREKQSS